MRVISARNCHTRNGIRKIQSTSRPASSEYTDTHSCR